MRSRNHAADPRMFFDDGVIALQLAFGGGNKRMAGECHASPSPATHHGGPADGTLPLNTISGITANTSRQSGG
jgi:hypothetical protein